MTQPKKTIPFEQKRDLQFIRSWLQDCESACGQAYKLIEKVVLATDPDDHPTTREVSMPEGFVFHQLCEIKGNIENLMTYLDHDAESELEK